MIDHGSRCTSRASGQRLRHAGPPGSPGTVGDCSDDALAGNDEGAPPTATPLLICVELRGLEPLTL